MEENDNKQIKSLKDVTENLEIIISRAMSGIHVQDKFLRSIPEFSVALVYRKGLKKILKGFEKTLLAMQADYLKAIEDGSNLFETMIMYAQFYQCYRYYSDEIKIVTNLMKEYHYYVFDNKVIKTLLGYVRPDEDLVPYTKKGRSTDAR